jgi:hypothetical protein
MRAIATSEELEQNHNLPAHNSLIKGVDFLRKSTL